MLEKENDHGHCIKKMILQTNLNEGNVASRSGTALSENNWIANCAPPSTIPLRDMPVKIMSESQTACRIDWNFSCYNGSPLTWMVWKCTRGIRRWLQ